ncbi:glycosyltransferase family 2 protein [Marinobacter qingdaonensis]|uniref:Glycosyltransferase family 2 protein n=1 Tax=Marinobacter qingdaonensis TaxID=3108486 RepID=A0ABU5P0H7_9GAMM|nr:glycosyltransferase family 2 protein [Marinobacter sp. ASW11-75]MEA1081437.1 glycosyltransferase family 2 protein [Marinobacter sp. ASW11-75]
MENFLLTIVTCTFNRRDLLEVLFRSIVDQEQFGHSVKWLIIDDGSTDETGFLLHDLAERYPQCVDYLTIENGGKHRALNRAMSLVDTDWFMVVDSDDCLISGSLGIVLETIEKSGLDNVGMIAGLLRFKGSQKKKFSTPCNPCKFYDWVSLQGQFDFCPIFKTSVAKSILYPETPGEKYMAESWKYEEISKTHCTYFLNEELVCAEYLASGLSAKSKKIRISSPVSAMYVYFGQYMSDRRLGLKVRGAVNFWRFYCHALLRKKQCDHLKKPSRVWFFPGFFVFLYDSILGW